MHRVLAALAASTCYAPADGGGSGSALERLGEIKAIDDKSAMSDLARTLDAHRAAILEVAGDNQRKLERIERMLPEAQEKLDRVKAGARAEYVPTGDVGNMDARYVRNDGALRLGKTIDIVPLPNGEEAKHVRHGFLTDPYPVTREQAAVREAYAGLGLAFNLLGRNWSHPMVQRSYLAFREACLNVPGRSGEFFRSMFSDASVMKRVIANSDGIGGELISIPTIADVRRPTDLARRVAGLVQVIDAPARTFKPPIVTGRAVAYKRGSTGNDPARFPVQTFTTDDTSVSVVDRVINVLLDTNFVNEGGLVLPNPMGFVMDWIAQGDADTLEAAFIHGDTTSTHQDTLSSWTLGSYFATGQLDGSMSPLKLWKGFRRRAADDSTAADSSGTFDEADHYGALNAMGNLASGAVILTGLDVLYTELLANSLFTSYDKFGPQATMITGTLGAIAGTPIVISQFIRKEYASTGLFTGSGTAGIMVYVNPAAYVHYAHSGTNGDWDVTYPERGANYVGIQRSSVLTPRCLSTEKPVAVIRNL